MSEKPETPIKPLERKIDFDPDFTPNHPTNQEAARHYHLTYSPHRRAYVDEEGCLIRDEFGQRF